MNRIVVSLVLVAVSVVSVQAQMGGGMTGQGMMPGMMGQGQGRAPGMAPGGMMGQGLMPGGMMGGMMGAGAMPCAMMGQMMGGMPARSRGCIGMAGMMMTGCLDMPQMQKSLGLTAEQEQKLAAIQKLAQREAIRTGADIKVAELDLADLLAAEPVDMGKVEAKLKELESLRTRMALMHLKSSEEVKKVLSKEQLEKFQGMCAACQQAPPQAPKAPSAEAPPGEDPHHPRQ